MERAIESAHMGHPDFRANGRIFSTIYPDGKSGMVKLTPDQQRGFVVEYPETFEPASGAWGRQGCTTVHFASADPRILHEAMKLALQNTIRKKAARSPRP